ncbi:LOW QUALITY PROTEIN: HMCN1-like protein [Mya arenaria]|uniref:HMCN1-like protein n=1 Tax=Mya arenaria TaxID=6604 RepID=A0ABY7EAE6_MYAAR|nr:LOW QUALITY PROTEIN: HMCN1-like protein [Mya arenaria]
MTSPTDSNATVNAGSSKNFTCRTSGGLPQPIVEWYKTSNSSCTRNGFKIMNSIPSSPSEINGLIQVESSLLFTASSLDNNLWICCAANPPPNPPVIDDFNTITDYQMIENSTERLTCRSTGGNPLASLAWSCYNGIESNPNVSGGSISRSVQFTALRNQDNTCTCTATHEAGPLQQATMDVNIMYPPSKPEFKVDGTPVGVAISIIKDSDQTVTCHSFGKPNPSTNDFTWTKGSVIFQLGFKLDRRNQNSGWRQLQMYRYNNDDTIEYQQNSSYNRDAPSTPEIRMNTLSGDVITDQITVVINRQFELACKATAYPTANYSWTGGSRTYHTQILQDTITTKTNTSRTCTAHNVLKPSVGIEQTPSSSASIAVYINYPPEYVTVRHTIENGDIVLSKFNIMERATLNQSNPSSAFSWTGSNIQQTGSVLLRNNISRSEKGHMSCTAKNTMTHIDQPVEGLSSANITLNILYKKGESRQALTKGQKLRTLNAVEEDADDLPDEVENPMYESSQPAAMKQDSPDVLYALPKKKDGDIYAVVDKTNKRPNKSQGTKKQKNDAHDNAGFDIYENNQSPQHPAKKNVNHDGLVYADIVFANPPKGQKRLVIHGIDDMTVYADVDLTKKVDPFPDSNEEDGGKKEPNKK